MAEPTADSPFIADRTIELTVDDLVVGVRPIVPGDRDELVASLTRVSEEARFRRFFRTVERLSERELDYLTTIDYSDHFAWVAYLPEPQQGIGVSRYVRLAEEPQVAEAAVLVVDEFQGHGIGKVLLQLLSESAQANGITTFRGYALPENRPVLDAASAKGITSYLEDGIARLDVELPPPTGLGDSDIYRLLRQAAAGQAEFGV